MTNQKLSPAKFTLLGFQHMFAMFGATVLVPTLTGLSVSATLLFAGLGTLLFHLITGDREILGIFDKVADAFEKNFEK